MPAAKKTPLVPTAPQTPQRLKSSKPPSPAKVAARGGRKPAGPITKANRKPVKSPWPPEAPRVTALLKGLEKLYPNAECELHHKNAFELLCATILSAQCTDERVNKVTPHLFATFPTPADMAAAPPEVLEDIIKSTGFYRQKTKSLLATSKLLQERFGGAVPKTVDELLSLKGVARKTANVVLGTAYGVAVGVVVDTHVQRLSMRLGLTRNTTPEKIEQDLMQVVPQKKWIELPHLLIYHGRRMCFARKPDCEHCPLVPHCPSAFKET
ncbi:MAG: endonuclease III [Deltaproteobacteria bacterium]|nr:endonuclease III [Deltaproteobacteria bacterium]